MKTRLWLAFLFTCLTVSALADDRGAELHAAASRGDVAAVKALLDAGVPVDSPSEYGATALSFASDKGHAEVVKLLLERGAKPEVTDSFYESTPMTWAAYNGHAEVVKLLIGAGVDGGPAIGMAIQRDKLEVVKAVLASGKVEPKALENAYLAAKSANKPEAMAMLEAAGAKPPPPATAKIDPAILATYVGKYDNPQVPVTITLVEGVLQAGFGSQPASPLGAVDATHFRLLAFEGLSLTFQVEDGKAVAIELDQMGNKMTAKRVDEPAAATPKP